MAEPGRLVLPPTVRPSALRSAPARTTALVAMGLAVAAGLWQLPDAFRGVGREVRTLETATPLDRELRGARGVDVDTRVFAEARRVIPEDARYAVVTGPGVEVSNASTLAAVAPFAGYWLLPRRQVPDPAGADWILSYGGDLGSLGFDYAQVLEVGPGVTLAEVRR